MRAVLPEAARYDTVRGARGRRYCGGRGTRTRGEGGGGMC